MKSKVCRGMVFCLVATVVLSLFAACRAPVKEVAPSPIEITDQLGRVVKLDKIPQRIISLAPSNTEILFALGLAERVVAVTDFDNYPPEAQAKPKIGGFTDVDLERVVALSPDLILAAQIHEAEIVPALEERGLTVFTLDPKTIDEVSESINLVGKITGKDKEASHLVDKMRNRIKAVTDKTDKLSEAEKPRVFYVIWHDPLMTVGTDTWHHELIEMAGGKNIIQDTEGFPMLILEVLIEANPQVIIAGSGMGEGADLPFQFARTEPRLAGVDARINNRVYEIKADLMDRPGPRILDGFEQLAKFIHPELFQEK